MLLVGHGSNDSRLRSGEKVDLIVCHSDSKHLHLKLLPKIINFLSPSEKESVIVGSDFPVHTSEMKEKIETMSVLTGLSCSLGPGCTLNWLNRYDRVVGCC